MNLDELQSVRDSERRTDSLQQLRESFYADAGEFIKELREKRDRAAERAEDPFDAPEVDRLTSEIKAAEETVEAIYEKRLGKLVKAASLAAADMPAGTEGLTTEEQRLFDTLVEDIKTNRRQVLDVLAGDGPDPDGSAEGASAGAADAGPVPTGGRDAGVGAAGSRTPVDDEGAEGAVDAADVMGEPTLDSPSAPGTAPEDSGRASATEEQNSERVAGRTHGEPETEPAPAEIDRERVRITRDVGAIFGVDEREYDLAEDDVVQLPAENAGPLLDSDAAERL